MSSEGIEKLEIRIDESSVVFESIDPHVPGVFSIEGVTSQDKAISTLLRANLEEVSRVCELKDIDDEKIMATINVINESTTKFSYSFGVGFLNYFVPSLAPEV
jgi:hypothetical protein